MGLKKLSQDLINNMYFDYDDGQEIIEETALAALLQSEIAFCYPQPNKSKEDESVIALGVNCNDIFWWGCADLELFNYSEIQSLYESSFDKEGNEKPWGSIIWSCLHRKMRPQHPVEDMMKKQGFWTNDLEALPVRVNTG